MHGPQMAVNGVGPVVTNYMVDAHFIVATVPSITAHGKKQAFTNPLALVSRGNVQVIQMQAILKVTRQNILIIFSLIIDVNLGYCR